MSAQKVIKSTFDISGQHWKTFDPFLFIAYHKDQYPNGNGKLGLDPKHFRGRHMGSDFSNKDGFNMYHGEDIPGFPQHPHRGFETITVTRSGWVDHFDSMGAKGRYGEGDTQWMTAGKGMQHCEMFPMLNADKPNFLDFFQIWINLQAKNKMVEPDYVMFWAKDTPILKLKDGGSSAAGASAASEGAAEAGEVRVLAGAPEYFKATHPDLKVCAPPTASYASEAGSDVALWDMNLKPGASYTFPKALLGGEVTRVLYFYEGDSITVGADTVRGKNAAKLDATQDFTVKVSGSQNASILIMQGKPIGEPVAQHGPFVMNSQEEIMQTFADYRKTQFGGWPWDRPDPTNGDQAKKYAKFPDGHEETP